jgi:hypothetical protein
LPALVGIIAAANWQENYFATQTVKGLCARSFVVMTGPLIANVRLPKMEE